MNVLNATGLGLLGLTAVAFGDDYEALQVEIIDHTSAVHRRGRG